MYKYNKILICFNILKVQAQKKTIMDVSYYVTSKFTKNSYKNIIQIYILL